MLVRRDRQDARRIDAESWAMQRATERIDQRDCRHASQRRREAHRHFTRAEQPHPEMQEQRVKRAILPGGGEIPDQYAERLPRQDHRIGLIEPEALRAETIEAQKQPDRKEAAEQDEIRCFRAFQRLQSASDRPIERTVATSAAAARGRASGRGHRRPPRTVPVC